MQLLVKTTPAVEELLQVLTTEFGDKYKVSKYGFGGKAILIKKSNFVATGVYIRKNNKINIFGRFGSLWIQGFFGGLLIIAFVYSSWKKMENETYQFLKTKYA